MNRFKTTVKTIFLHILQYIIVLIGVTFITFSIMNLSPKNPAELYLAGPGGNVGTISQEAIEEQEKLMGLDRPFMEQYLSWLINAAHGELGESLITKQPVLQELLDHMWPTLTMTFLSLLITTILSVISGILYFINAKDKIKFD